MIFLDFEGLPPWEAFSLELRMPWFETYVKPVLDTLTAIGTLVALGALVVTVIKNRRDEDARMLDSADL